MDRVEENVWFIVQPATSGQEGLVMRTPQQTTSTVDPRMNDLPCLPDGTCPEDIPIDGGTGILLAAGAVLGFKKLKGKVKKPF